MGPLVTRPHDRQRKRVYAAQSDLMRMLDRCAASANPQVTLASITLTLPTEARFAAIADAQRYIDRILSWDAVIERLGTAAAVTVRARRGSARAHYERDTQVIALPPAAGAHGMLRELVLVHELAHHFTPDTVAIHGPEFVGTLVTLVDTTMGPHAALALRILMDHHGAREAPAPGINTPATTPTTVPAS